MARPATAVFQRIDLFERLRIEGDVLHQLTQRSIFRAGMSS